MTRPVPGKSYLFVQCRSCSKHFRVVDEPVFEGKVVEISGPQTLACRSCGAVATYDRSDMQIASIERRKKTGF
jgi:hypothetical protein